MADIFTFGKSQAVSVAPQMGGLYFSNIDNSQGVAALGYSVPWGGSALLTKPVAVEQVVEGASGTTTDGISEAVTSINDVVKSVFEGLSGIQGAVGPQGPPGASAMPILVSGPAGIPGTDGIDAFMDIDIPIPYDGWEGAFTNNDPGAGSVSWTAFKLKYKGVEYTIAAGNTSKVWLYWDVATPSALSSTDTRSTATGTNKFFVGYNNSGTFEQSQFIKLITAGFISVTALSALAADLGTITSGTITMNLGSTYRLQISPSGIRGSTNSGSSYFNIITLDGTDVVLQGTKLKLASVATAKIADDATKILSPVYYAGALGALTTSEVEYGAVDHVSDGGNVKVSVNFIVQNASATTGVQPSFGLYYDGDLVATTTSRVIGIGEYQTESLSAYVDSDAGTKAVSFTALRGAGQSTLTYLYNVYIEAVEDKGK